MSNLLEVAKKIENQLSAPMGDGGAYLDTLAELRAAIREETIGTDPAIQTLAVERSSGLLRAMIETDAQRSRWRTSRRAGGGRSLGAQHPAASRVAHGRPRHSGGEETPTAAGSDGTASAA